MKLIILVPRVIQGFISQFPETTQNAYKYFNYDRRVYDERAEHRFDNPVAYKGPEDLSDQDYMTIVSYAKTLINPILSKYSYHIACEDALHLAIKSYGRGKYDGKINASKYEVLLKAMKAVTASDVEAKKHKVPAKPKTQVIPKILLKRLDITNVPLKSKVRPYQKGDAPMIVRQPGKGIVIEKKEGNQLNFNKEDRMSLKNAQQYTERLDKIADELQSTSPELALVIDKISDVIEGKKDASTLKFDADEARYMANRFNMDVRKREADEPYMDDYNKSNFEQVMTVRKNPVPIKLAYQKVQK